MKIVPVFLRYDYGIKSRGDSLEYRGFYTALQKIADEVYPFWFDEYLTRRDELQKQVIRFVEEIRPNVIFFILMKNEFSFQTLDYLKNKYVTLNWFCDDQWRFENFTKYYATHFTYAITTDKFSLNKYKSIGCENVILSQWGSFLYNENIDFETMSYKYDVSFVGGISGYREWIVKELSKRGINVECFGYSWKNGKISFEETAEVFKSSRINLNISNSVSRDIRYIFSSVKNLKEFIVAQKRFEQIKARNFEIPASGGFELTNYIAGLDDYFLIGGEIAVYSSVDDLALQIKYYLNNESERKKIMLEGFKRAISEHTYYQRFKNIFDKITVKTL